MNIVNFISRRFNSTANMPRSIRMMRLVSAVGIAVAVIALVVALSIGKGFEKVYTRALLDFNAHVIVMGAGEIEDPTEAYEKLEKLKAEGEVLTINSFLYREALLMGKDSITGAVIKGIEQGKYGSVGNMSIELFKREGNTKKVPVIMGRALAQRMGIENKPVVIRMLIPGKQSPKDPSNQFDDVLAVGTFQAGMHDYDDQFMLMNIEDARKLFGAGANTVTGIELRLDDPNKAASLAEAVEGMLGPRYRAVTWQELNADLLAAVKLEKLVTSLIMGIMLIVAALNIIAALVLTTLHRMREISVLKALGLTDRLVEKIFVRGGMGIGMRGVLIGLIVGLIAVAAEGKFRFIPLEAEVYLVDSLPIDISWVICGIITLFCAAVLYVTSRIAARRLAKVPPAEGLMQVR